MASDQIVPITKERNPITQEAHQRQTFWQIYFPLIIFGALVLITIALVLLADDQGTSKWADISLIFMISLAMVAFILITIFLVISVIYSRKLIIATPYFFFIVQKYAYIIEIRVKKTSNVAVEPFLRLNSYIAGVRAIRRK